MASAIAGTVARHCSSGECEAAIALLEQAVRNCPSDFEFYYRLGVCYAGGCRPHPLVNPGMAAACLRHALRLAPETPQARAVILEQLGSALLRASDPRAAVACLLETAGIYAALRMADDRGRTEFNLANAYCELSEATGEDHWDQAVLHYKKSLRFRTRKKHPELHAAVLVNLGTAYRQIRSADRRAGVRRAIRCYLRALNIYQVVNSDKIAGVENNLGNALLSLPDLAERAAVRNARRALRHFDRALRNQPRGSRAFAITQYNRAQAYFRLARRSPLRNLSRAVDCLQDAAAAFEACGERRYDPLIRSQLAWIRRGVPESASPRRPG